MSWTMITIALLALAIGIWIGLGAPGWPHKQPQGGSLRRRSAKRPINPIAWARPRESEHRARSRRRR